MIYTGLNRTGEIETVKANGGADVAEVYGGIGEGNPIYYKQREMVGTSPMQFKALGLPLKDYLISGDTIQDGTPTPQAPVDVVGCGIWDETQQSYKLSLYANGTEYPIYLGQVETTKRIKKVVLTGDENWLADSTSYKLERLPMARNVQFEKNQISSHYTFCRSLLASDIQDGQFYVYTNFLRIKDLSHPNAASFKSYLAAQYAAGIPVTVWYALAESETGIVNEPLMKISDYADTISMTQASVTIPTIAGTNTLTIDTTVQPSSVSITGHIKPTGYGQLLDVNGVDIQDKNGMPIFIQG